MSKGSLCALALLLCAGCSNSSAESPPDMAKSAVAAPTEEAAEETPKPPAPVAIPSTPHPGGACGDADLSLPASMVVGTVNGESIAAGDFGDDAKGAELDARRSYCNELDRIRESALQRAIDDKLLAAAAKTAGVDVDKYLQDTIATTVEEPPASEVEAFYDANKKPDAPPFAAVADQVKASIMRERSQAAYEKHIRELETKAEVARSLPDVRPAALPVDIPEHTATFGTDEAAVEIVEFSDFECPYCARAAEAVRSLEKTYGDKVKFAYRHFPLSFHPNAKSAALYAQCAKAQGKFWKMHDAIFAAEGLSAEALRTAAKSAKVDVGKLDECLASTEVQAEVTADLKKATELGVGGTPTFFINGRLFNGSPTADGLSQAIESELARAQG